MYYNFCTWWDEAIPTQSLNIFAAVKDQIAQYLWTAWYLEDWETKSGLHIDFYSENKLIDFLNVLEASVKDQGLELVWADHGTKPKTNQVIFCVRQVATTLWRPENYGPNHTGVSKTNA